MIGSNQEEAKDHATTVEGKSDNQSSKRSRSAGSDTDGQPLKKAKIVESDSEDDHPLSIAREGSYIIIHNLG